MEIIMEAIAHISTKFRDKFGVPRQSGITSGMSGKIVFEPKFRRAEAFKELENFSHIWIIWEFSEIDKDKEWSPTVRPPKLGGNKRVGVFATRSPYRPNRMGLSSVRLDRIDFDCADAPVLYVTGADMVDGTPIFDIKPYLPYVDCHPDAKGGYTEDIYAKRLAVRFKDGITKNIPQNTLDDIADILSADPRPSYQNDAGRTYGMFYDSFNIKFKVSDGVLTVCEISQNPKE